MSSNPPAIVETSAPAPEGAPQDGLWLQHDKAGTLRTKAALHQGLLHGPLSLFDEHGSPALEAHYAHGKIEGIRRIYVDGRLHSAAHYRDGLQHGEAHLYHARTGGLAATLPFHDGKLHGQASYFDEDGNLARRASYDAGKLHGDTTSFYPDGAIMSTEPYAHGQLDGESKWFSAQGDLVKRALFVQGKRASAIPAASEPVPSTAPKRTLTIKPR